MKLFDRKNVNNEFISDLQESIQKERNEKEVCIALNPFSLENFKDTSGFKYPEAKEPSIFYNNINNIEKVQIQSADHIDNSEQHSKCCIIL